MTSTLEFSSKYACKGISAILEALPVFEENMKVIVTSENTIKFIQSENSECVDIREDEGIQWILQPAGIPDGEYWWK